MHQAIKYKVGQDLGIGPRITIQFKIFINVQRDINLLSLSAWDTGS